MRNKTYGADSVANITTILMVIVGRYLYTLYFSPHKDSRQNYTFKSSRI